MQAVDPAVTQVGTWRPLGNIGDDDNNNSEDESRGDPSSRSGRRREAHSVGSGTTLRIHNGRIDKGRGGGSPHDTTASSTASGDDSGGSGAGVRGQTGEPVRDFVWAAGERSGGRRRRRRTNNLSTSSRGSTINNNNKNNDIDANHDVVGSGGVGGRRSRGNKGSGDRPDDADAADEEPAEEGKAVQGWDTGLDELQNDLMSLLISSPAMVHSLGTGAGPCNICQDAGHATLRCRFLHEEHVSREVRLRMEMLSLDMLRQKLEAKSTTSSQRKQDRRWGRDSGRGQDRWHGKPNAPSPSSSLAATQPHAAAVPTTACAPMTQQATPPRKIERGPAEGPAPCELGAFLRSPTGLNWEDLVRSMRQSKQIMRQSKRKDGGEKVTLLNKEITVVFDDDAISELGDHWTRHRRRAGHSRNRCGRGEGNGQRSDLASISSSISSESTFEDSDQGEVERRASGTRSLERMVERMLIGKTDDLDGIVAAAPAAADPTLGGSPQHNSNKKTMLATVEPTLGMAEGGPPRSGNKRVASMTPRRSRRHGAADKVFPRERLERRIERVVTAQMMESKGGSIPTSLAEQQTMGEDCNGPSKRSKRTQGVIITQLMEHAENVAQSLQVMEHDEKGALCKLPTKRHERQTNNEIPTGRMQKITSPLSDRGGSRPPPQTADGSPGETMSPGPMVSGIGSAFSPLESPSMPSLPGGKLLPLTTPGMTANTTYYSSDIERETRSPASPGRGQRLTFCQIERLPKVKPRLPKVKPRPPSTFRPIERPPQMKPQPPSPIATPTLISPWTMFGVHGPRGVHVSPHTALATAATASVAARRRARAVGLWRNGGLLSGMSPATPAPIDGPSDGLFCDTLSPSMPTKFALIDVASKDDGFYSPIWGADPFNSGATGANGAVNIEVFDTGAVANTRMAGDGVETGFDSFPADCWDCWKEVEENDNGNYADDAVTGAMDFGESSEVRFVSWDNTCNGDGEGMEMAQEDDTLREGREATTSVAPSSSLVAGPIHTADRASTIDINGTLRDGETVAKGTDTPMLVILPESLSINRREPTCLQAVWHRLRRTRGHF